MAAGSNSRISSVIPLFIGDPALFWQKRPPAPEASLLGHRFVFDKCGSAFG